MWCSALVVMAVVVWCWDASCVHCESYCSNSTHHQENKSVHCRILCFALVVMAVVVWELGRKLCEHSHHHQCRTPYVAVHTLVLLMIGIIMPETC